MNNKIIYLFILLIITIFTLSSVYGLENNAKYLNNNKEDMGNVIWVRGAEMNSIDFKTLKESNINTILLNFAAVDYYGKENVTKWVETANKNGINVHIWMQVLYHNGFQNPITNGSINQDLLEKDINDSTLYASIPGIKGIILDYIRYPGTASYTPNGSQAVSLFVTNLTKNIKNTNNNLIVSATLMPEQSRLLQDYGQNLSNISSQVDYIMPMEYKGNYEQNTSWIKSTTHYFVENTEGAKVITSLQTYKSDNNISKLSTTELKADIDSAYAGGASGIGVFRYGLVDLNNIKDNLNPINQFKQFLFSSLGF